jgi:hypothetical protein
MYSTGADYGLDARTAFDYAHRALAQADLAFAKAYPASWVSLQAVHLVHGNGYSPDYAEGCKLGCKLGWGC